MPELNTDQFPSGRWPRTALPSVIRPTTGPHTQSSLFDGGDHAGPVPARDQRQGVVSNASGFPMYRTPLSSVERETSKRTGAGKDFSVVNHEAAMALGPEHYRKSAANAKDPQRQEHFSALADASAAAPPSFVTREHPRGERGVVTSGLPYRQVGGGERKKSKHWSSPRGADFHRVGGEGTPHA